MSDSVSVFAEGTFEEQIQELVNYLARGLSDEDRVSYIRPFQDALLIEGSKPLAEDEPRRVKVFSLVLEQVKSLGEGNEREIEGFFNLLYSHLLTLFPSTSPELQQHITALISVIVNSSQTITKYRLLSNLFNALPRQSKYRLQVFNALLNLASTNDDLDVLQLEKPNIEKWLADWEIATEEKSQILKRVADAYTKTGHQEMAYLYLAAYLHSLSPQSPLALSAALETIAAALLIPTVFNFDALLRIDTLRAAKDHQLFALLQIFLNDGLKEYLAWTDSNASIIEQFALDKQILEEKIRLLTLASLGSRNIGKDLPYSQIATALQIDGNDVEKWVIDVIRAKLLSGKLSQPTKTVHVTRATSRAFGKDEWEALEKRLLAWRTGLTGVLEVVGGAKKNNAAAAVAKVVQVA